MKISLIVAMASNRVIGADNKMPWHLPADLKRFKQITMGSPILMGRKTHESIGRPLPGRTNIVISRNQQFQAQGCLVYSTIESALQSLQTCKEIFIIGGSTLYDSILPKAETIFLTEIHREFHGDTYFPELGKDQWLEIERESINNSPEVSFSYSFVRLERI